MDADIVRFSDEKVRPVCDTLKRAFYEAQAVLDEWYGKGFGFRIPVDPTPVADSSLNDGRTQITFNDINLVMARLSEFVADYKDKNNAKLNTVLKPSVNKVM